MKHIFSITAFFTVLSILIFSCAKHKDDIEEKIPVANISFTSPSATLPYQIGDSVAIVATAISTETIHGYDLIVRKSGDTTKLFFEQVHDHNDTILVNKKWKNTIAGPANMEAQIVLYLDHDGHTGSKKAMFKVY